MRECNFFYQHQFLCMPATLLACENQGCQDVPGIEPIFHRKNRVKIRYRVGGVAEHTHTHTHTRT